MPIPCTKPAASLASGPYRASLGGPDGRQRKEHAHPGARARQGHGDVVGRARGHVFGPRRAEERRLVPGGRAAACRVRAASALPLALGLPAEHDSDGDGARTSTHLLIKNLFFLKALVVD